MLSGDQTKQNCCLLRLVTHPGTNQRIEQVQLITILFQITMYINNLSTERSVPSPVPAGDSGRDPNSPAQPAWISIARQKQRGMQQEQELDGEKLVALDVKSDTEKQNKEKEQTEVLTVQICDAFVSPSCSILWIHCYITVML